MSWLDELDYANYYECPKCGSYITTAKGNEEILKEETCRLCNTEKAIFIRWELADKIGLTIRASYEQHGRKAYRTSFADGSTSYISATKKDFREKGDSKTKYSTSAQKAMKETLSKQASFAKASEI